MLALICTMRPLSPFTANSSISKGRAGGDSTASLPGDFEIYPYAALILSLNPQIGNIFVKCIQDSLKGSGTVVIIY